MTLETLNQEIIALSSTIAASTSEVPDVAIANENVGAILKGSPTLDFAYQTWCKYLLEYDLLSSTEGMISGRDTLIGTLAEISDGIVNTIENRKQEREWMVEDAKCTALINSRMSYIESLGDEIKFCEWADWLVEDPFYNVEPVVQEWIPGDEFWGETSGVSGVSGHVEKTEPVFDEMSEERKNEIRAKWIELGDYSKYDVNVEFPVYDDFVDGYENQYVLENRDDIVVSILQDTALAEVFTNRDHGLVWRAISKVLKTLSSYNSGTPSERGKVHSAALREVIVRALSKIMEDVVEGRVSVRDYKFSGPTDPVFVKMCDSFRDLIDFTYVSPKRFDFTTSIVIDDGEVVTTENFSLFDL